MIQEYNRNIYIHIYIFIIFLEPVHKHVRVSIEGLTQKRKHARI